MPKHDRLWTLNAMLDTGLVPLFYNPDLEVAKALVTACAEGGARVIEFTNRGDRAWSVFTPLAEWCEVSHPDVALGVGTVVDAPTAAMYIGSGASFVVGPNLSEEIARTCNRRKVAYLPGCGTVSEISKAEELGCEIVKVFPAGELGGPGFIKSVRAPMPWVRLLPTGGVDATEQSIAEWIGAGAACLGMGSKLIRGDLVKAKDFDSIARLVEQVLEWIRIARQASVRPEART